MSVEIVGLIAILVAGLGFYFPPSFIVTAFFCATLLGSAAAFILESVGGLNISPAHFLLGVVAIRLLGQRDVRTHVSEAISPGKPGFWLLLTIIYSLLSAYFMPRIFANQTAVFPVRITMNTVTIPLEPSMSNVTQSIYLVADFVCFILLYAYGRDPEGQRTLGKTALLCVILNLCFAALDLATFWTGTGELLSFIRNANYSIMSGAEMFGFKRIVGSFVEASSFASATLGYFAFTFQLYLMGIRPRLMFILSALSFTALIFSTAGTGYVGGAVFLFLVYVQTLLSWLRKPLTTQKATFLVCMPFVALIVALAILFNSDASTYVGNLLDTLIFNKTQSDSGTERAAWNHQGIENFLDTFGFGAGNGSLRASSFPVAVLGSLGFIGTAIFAAFFIGIFFGQPADGHPDPSEEPTRKAAKAVCVAWLITACTSGTLTDLGLPFFAFAALASSGAPQIARRQQFPKASAITGTLPLRSWEA